MSSYEETKVVMIISSSIGGGAQILFADVINALKNKYEVLAICPDGYLAKILRQRGIEPYISEINIRTMRKIRKYVLSWANGSPITINSYIFGTSYYTCRSFHNIRKCKVFSLLLNPIIRSEEPKLKQIAYRFIAKYIGKKSNVIGVGSPELEKEVKMLTGRDSIYLENRVPNQKEYRNSIYKRDERPLKVCFVGRMVYQKRPDLFVQAAKILFTRNCNIEFYMAGQGELKSEIEKYVEDNHIQNVVKFVGFIDNLYDFLYDMDVLALTSCFENTPLIVLNSMNAGVPVVSGNVVGVPHLIDNGINGIITEKYTSESFADAIQKIEEDDSFYQRLSMNAYIKAITDFSFDQFITEYEKAL